MERDLNLVVDRGNTRTKVAVFNKRELYAHAILTESLEDFLVKQNILNRISEIVLISDTRGGSIELPLHLQPLFLGDVKSFPIDMKYRTSKTLGNDRLANACAASLYGSKCMIIDAGTCLTTEYVVGNTFIGGSISPGIQMRYDAMHHFTGKLPQLEIGPPVLVGDSTEECMHSGALNGAILELNNRIKESLDHFEDLTILLTGGDARYFEKHLNCTIFADPNLTLKGLNEILLYNT